ncbi:hypothetical protein QT972_31530, partial [Microcoleus sp. herbarium7]|uniref:hypothetical protein n=1 Tax=Microcoleus sp. herbarium7 TaxID=3055435 RepID=UPI002FD39185
PLSKGGLGGVKECCTTLEKWYNLGFLGLWALKSENKYPSAGETHFSAQLSHELLRHLAARLAILEQLK